MIVSPSNYLFLRDHGLLQDQDALSLQDGSGSDTNEPSTSMSQSNESMDTLECGKNPPSLESIRIGKKLAYILRYGATKEGLCMDSEDYVTLKEIAALPLFEKHSYQAILDCVQNSRGCLGENRFKHKTTKGGLVAVCASYGRAFDRTEFHAGTKVKRLLAAAIDTVARESQNYDMASIGCDYIVRLLMRRKVILQGKLTDKVLRQFLVPCLVHLDLSAFSCVVNEKTMKLAASTCPNVESLSLSSASYIATDHILTQLLKSFSKLRWLNVRHCNHLTDKTLAALTRHCPQLEFVNLTYVYRITEAYLIDMLDKLSKLNLVILGDFNNFTPSGLVRLRYICGSRPSLKLVGPNLPAGLATSICDVHVMDPFRNLDRTVFGSNEMVFLD